MKKIYLDNNWKFVREDREPHDPAGGWGGAEGRAYAMGAAAVRYDDRDWKDIFLPHDYVLEGDYTRYQLDQEHDIAQTSQSVNRHFNAGSLEGGPAWYRKKFRISSELAGRQFILHFDGVYRHCNVYLNENYVGSHECGYDGFSFDVTDLIYTGKDDMNTLALRLDSSEHEGWWYEGGGIYDHVWLEVLETVDIRNEDIHIISEIADGGKSATVQIVHTLMNRNEDDHEVRVRYRIIRPDNEEETSGEFRMVVPGADQVTDRAVVDVVNPFLWSVESPFLYTAVISVEDEEAGEEAEAGAGEEAGEASDAAEEKEQTQE
jgi:beta-galactosidase